MLRGLPPRLRSPAVIAPMVLGVVVVVALLVTLGRSGPPADGDQGDGTRRPGSGRTLLGSSDAQYPRAIRLRHNGHADGRVLVSTVAHPGGGNLGEFQESTDDGASFHHAGTLDSSKAGRGHGLCCGTLFELPRRIGDMPAGTLLWAASFGADEPDRRMTIRVYRSTDLARSWSYLSTVAATPGTGGLWEPEFAVDAHGDLVCFYSDETDPGHSQKLVAVRSRDGVGWSAPRDTVASALRSDRPGMAVVRRLPGGKYLMTYEICAAQGQYSCVAHYRTSADGWDWGDPTYLGIRAQTAAGEYFRHAPAVAWAPQRGNPRGRLLLVGQALYRADGSRAPDSGRVILTNSRGGAGPWRKVSAPVTVKSTRLDACPNYSSSLLPSSDGSRLLEVATDLTGGRCRPYVATGGL